MKPLPGSVLVGVTGHGENTEALRFALREAERLGCGLTLVHAIAPTPPPPPGGVLVTYEESWAELARDIVREVAAEVDGLQATAGTEVPVATMVGHGSPGALLSDLSRDVRLVVVQHQHVHRLVRLVTGSTAARVAAHAHCPVVSVPAADEEEPPRSGEVVVGVHDDGGPAEVVAAAVAQARLHGWSTRLVHAFRLPGPYDQVVAADVSWTEGPQAALERAAAAHPGADVTVDVRHAWPADALVELSRTASLVVVGRHGGRGPISPRLGSRARSVLAGSHAPVMVVPLAGAE